MSLLPRRLRASSRADLVVGGVVCAAVLALAVASPGRVGMLLAGLAIAVAVGVVALGDPLVALVLLVLSSFVRLAQKEIVSIEFLTPAFLALLAALALAIMRGAKRPPQLGVVEWLMAAYLAVNILSWMLPHQYEAIDPSTGASADPYRWILTGTILPFVTYVVAKSVLDDERSVRWMLWAVVGMTAYSAWVSIMQFHGPKWLVWPSYIVDAPNWVGRANGVFNQPVVNGVILDVGFVTCLFLASRPGVGRRVQALLYVVAAASAYSVYLTHTRAALLGLVIALVLGLVFAVGWRRGFVVTTALGVAAVAANASSIFSSDRSSGGVASTSELYDRLNLIATGLRAITEHPFLGIGIARFANYNTSNHVAWSQHVPWGAGYGIVSHENEVAIAAELGIPGALLWIAVVVSVLYMLWRAMRELPRDTFLGAPLALVGAIATVVMVENGLTVDMRILDFALLLPFLYAGMVVGQLERHRARRGDLRPGVPGGGLPGGLSHDEQRAWQANHSTRPEDRPLQPAR